MNRIDMRLCGAAVIVIVALTGAPQAQLRPQAILPDARAVDLMCGTSSDRDDRRGNRTLATAGIADGEALSFEQDPALALANQPGPVTLRNFEIAGDYPTVQFRRSTAEGDVLETWRRVTTRSVAGRVVSVFEPSWTSAQLASALSASPFGFDGPELYWGSYVTPRTASARFVYLRMGLGGIAASEVVRINDRVQYASNLVNIVVPGFGDARVTGGSQSFELSAVTHAFYEQFADRYDVLSIVPQATPVADWGAFHRNVQNRVSGLNLDLFDESASYGSSMVLQGVEVYAAATATHFRETNHEMAHQWGSNFDWARIAGIARAGHEPSSHAPLWTGGETLLGAVLYGDRRVRAVDGTYQIEQTPAPARFHPVELYAMGMLDAQHVPDFGVFMDQAQFSSLTPDAGTPLRGSVRRVTIDDIVREHGPRLGPAPSASWRRATVLVSRDRLATPAEMSYWNFFAQRLANRSQRAVATLDGYVPFRTATNDRVALTTAITPWHAVALPQVLDTDAPAFGASDFRDVAFSAPVPTRFDAAGETMLSGRVVAPGVDVTQVELVFWKEGSPSVAFDAAVRTSGDFTIPIRFAADARGRYNVGLYLFWDGAGPQRPRTTLNAVTVE
jgi:hypothetical protein